MTISTTQTRVSYNGNGVTDEFAFPYLFFGASDLEVYLVDVLGASSLLTLNTDYTVTGVGDESGGEVTMVVPPASGERLVIVRVVSLTQETDYIEGDPFPAESHERGLDLLTMQTQQLQEALTRTLQLPVTSDADASAIDPSAVEAVAGIAADVTTVALNDANITTVATNTADVTTVATNIADVTTVATNIADVTTVATNIANVNATATNIAAITDAPNQAAAAAQSAIDAQDAADAAAISAASIALPLAIGSGGTGQTTAANAFNALKQAATESATGVVELATPTEAQAADATRVLTGATLKAAQIQLGTAVASTSGTAIDFTGIPSWVKRVTLLFDGVSTTGTSKLVVRIGDSGGISATGYQSQGGSRTGENAETTGYGLHQSAVAASLHSGMVTLMRVSGNTWVASGVLTASASAPVFSGGTKTLSGDLDRVRLTTVGGTDTFDAGSLNISWE